MRLFIAFLSAAMLFASAFGAEVKVAAAANTKNVFDDLIKAFNVQFPSVKIAPSFGPSGSLATQIKNGAPFEVYLSADVKFPNELYQLGLTQEKPEIYARGALALFSTSGIDLSKGLEVLKDKKVKKISIANPKTAPYGKASVEALQKTALYDLLAPKFVQAENIAQVAAQTIAAADAGFVAKSTFFTPNNIYKENIHWISVPSSLYSPIEQGIALLKGSSGEAKKFYDFVLSPSGQAVFKSYGYEIK